TAGEGRRMRSSHQQGETIMKGMKVWVCSALCALAVAAFASVRDAKANPLSQTGSGQITLVNNMEEAVDLYDDDDSFVCPALKHLSNGSKISARTHNFKVQYTDGTLIGSITLTIEAGGTGVITVSPR